MLGWLLQVWNDWGMEILVLLSFGLQLLLSTFAGVRRRGWYGAYILVQFVVWAAYQLAHYTTTYALGRITFCSWSREHQIVAFWAPFLVLHLGAPDNITAYAFEDNQLSWRLVFSVIGNILGAGYALYSYIGGAGTLVPASILMLAVGVAKYVERTCALMRANLDSIRSSFDKQQLAEADGAQTLLFAEADGPQTAPRCSFDQQQLAEADGPQTFLLAEADGPQTASRCSFDEQQLAEADGLDDGEELLLFAHSLFHVCKRAMVDSSIEDTQAHHGDGIALFDYGRYYGWKDARAVIEMELSLMYDILYTKAALIHTWHGYGIRVVSPILIAAAFLLFHIGSHDGYRRFDVIITYFLFSAAFLQEMASLLGALLSSWAVAALNARRRPGWLFHAVLCTRRWAKAVCYRRWPGTIGQCNLLHLCTGDTTDLSSGLPTKNLKISKQVKELVFETIPEILLDEQRKSMVTTTWGRGALDKLNFLEDDKKREILKMALGGEFQEGILTWHIATDIYLFNSKQAMEDNEASRVEAIRTLSNYVMFLTVERPHMVPGLVVRSLYELTCKDLAKIWISGSARSIESSSCCRNFCNVWLKKIFPLHKLKKLLNLYDDPNSSRLLQRKQLAKILLDREGDYVTDERVKSHLPSAVRLARRLIEVEDRVENLLDVIFQVWLDMLIYAASHCNRDSHGKQLSSGGELTTVVWLMAEHAGLFRINKANNYEKGNAPSETDYPYNYPGGEASGLGAPHFPANASHRGR